jgi:hypothetical protein
MITCPSCGHVQDEDTPRCERCATPLDKEETLLECPACQAPNPADRQYCRHCFAALQGEEADAQDESLVSPYVPASASPDEFRGRRQPIRPTTKPERDPDSVDLDATIGEMAVHGEQDERPHIGTEADDSESSGAAPRQEAVIEDSPQEPEDQDAPQSEAIVEEPASAAKEPADDEPAGEPAVAADDAAPSPSAISKPEPAPKSPEDAPLPTIIPTEDGRSEQEGKEPLWLAAPDSPLDHVDNPIPMESIIALPHRSIPPIERPPTEQERADARLFQQIAVEPAPLHTSSLQLLPRRPEILSRTGRTILYLLVLLAALSPILTGGQTTAWVQPRPAVVQLASDLSALPGGSVVLVSFEYSPSFAGELNPLATAVLRHLAAQSVPIVAMSTRPEGVGLAEQVLAAVADATPGYTYGQDYVILGYLPGQEAGLRTMAHSMADAFAIDHVLGGRLDQFPPTQGLATIQDATQILLLADDDMAVRRWIEQLGSRYALQRSPLRLQALVTARIEPMLVAYAEAGQLDTVIAGVYGAPQYAAIRSPATGIGSDDRGVALPSGLGPSTDAFAALFGLVLLVCVATNVLYAVRGETASAGPHAPHSTLGGKKR